MALAVLICSDGFGSARLRQANLEISSNFLCMPVLTDGSTLSAYYSHLPPLVAILSTSFTLTHTVTQRLRNSGVTRYAYTQLCVNYGVFLNFGSKTAIIVLLEFRFSTKATNLEKHLPSFEFQFRLIKYKFNYIFELIT